MTHFRQGSTQKKLSGLVFQRSVWLRLHCCRSSVHICRKLDYCFQYLALLSYWSSSPIQLWTPNQASGGFMPFIELEQLQKNRSWSFAFIYSSSDFSLCAVRHTVSETGALWRSSGSNDWCSCAACDEEEGDKQQPCRCMLRQQSSFKDLVLVFKLSRFRRSLYPSMSTNNAPPKI